MNQVALEILKYPKLCGMNIQNNYGNTVLIWSCINNLDQVALKILKYPELCGMNIQNNFGDTALIWSCKNKMEQITLEILKYPELCGMNIQNKDNKTALILSCENKMEQVALEILKYPESCGISMQNSEKILKIAYDNKLELVVLNLFNYIESSKSDNFISFLIKTSLNWYLSDEEKKERQLYLEQLTLQADKLNKIKNDVYKKNECIVCYEKTINNSLFIKCKHILYICDDCNNNLEKKCPLCNCATETTRDLYVAQ
jgi:hypothetical protein